MARITGPRATCKSPCPWPLLEAKRHRLYVGSLTVLVAALLSAGVGLLLAKRMREPLGAVMGALRSIRQGRYDIQPAHDR